MKIVYDEKYFRDLTRHYSFYSDDHLGSTAEESEEDVQWYSVASLPIEVVQAKAHLNCFTISVIDYDSEVGQILPGASQGDGGRSP
jgi:hypothetical protein